LLTAKAFLSCSGRALRCDSLRFENDVAVLKGDTVVALGVSRER
jgi:hypothetical protein